jgi:hypothetical protein
MGNRHDIRNARHLQQNRIKECFFPAAVAVAGFFYFCPKTNRLWKKVLYVSKKTLSLPQT